ncbi:MAG: response regulator [Acidobacteriota bacterium]
MSKRTLLLADDSATIQKVVNLTFADEGIDVITVGDGDSAMVKLAETRPDLVMADVHMPGLSGYEICEKIRADESTRDLPVMLLVGSFEPFDETEAQRVGANAFLTKPFQSIRQLVSQVTDLMNARPTSGEPAVEEARDGTDESQTEDIDGLYVESFAETIEMAPHHSERVFVDSGMDDEMIETSYTAGADDNAGSPPAAALPVELGMDSAPEFVVEQPLSQSVSFPAETLRMEMPDLLTEDFGAAAQQTGHSSANVAPQTETGFSTPETTSETHKTISATPFVDPFAQTTNFEFDEINLLDIPDDETPVEFATTAESAHAGTNKQVVSLSPELIEMIVQRVVEKLSEKY